MMGSYNNLGVVGADVWILQPLFHVNCSWGPIQRSQSETCRSEFKNIRYMEFQYENDGRWNLT